MESQNPAELLVWKWSKISNKRVKIVAIKVQGKYQSVLQVGETGICFAENIGLLESMPRLFEGLEPSFASRLR